MPRLGCRQVLISALGERRRGGRQHFPCCFLCLCLCVVEGCGVSDNRSAGTSYGRSKSGPRRRFSSRLFSSLPSPLPSPLPRPASFMHLYTTKNSNTNSSRSSPYRSSCDQGARAGQGLYSQHSSRPSSSVRHRTKPASSKPCPAMAAVAGAAAATSKFHTPVMPDPSTRIAAAGTLPRRKTATTQKTIEDGAGPARWVGACSVRLGPWKRTRRRRWRGKVPMTRV